MEEEKKDNNEEIIKTIKEEYEKKIEEIEKMHKEEIQKIKKEEEEKCIRNIRALMSGRQIDNPEIAPTKDLSIEEQFIEDTKKILGLKGEN